MKDEELNLELLRLIEIIHNYRGDEEVYEDFRNALNNKSLNWGLLYRVCINLDVYDLSDLIISSHNYDLYLNDDIEMTQEIKGCIISRCDDLLFHYLADNYFPTDVALIEIMEFYKQLDKESFNKEIFNQFKHMNKLLKVKNIKNNLHRK
jgi:hypothetical protein